MYLIVNGLLPFHYVEKQVITKHVKYYPPILETFRKYLHLPIEHVEQKISALLPNNFALIFDGWSCGSTHYVAVFASYSDSCDNGYQTRLPNLSPVGDECSLSSQGYRDFLTCVLELYQKSWANIVWLISDKLNTNKALSTILQLPLIRCASHRLNLAMKEKLKDREELLQKVDKIMIELCGLLLAEKQKKPKIPNATR